MAVVFAGVKGSSINGLEATASLFDYNAAYTAMFWVRFNSIPSTYDQVVWAAYTGTGPSVDEIVAGASQNLFYVVFVNGTSTTHSLGSIVINTWYHVAIARTSATSLTIYINGSAVYTSTVNVAARPAQHNMTVGCAGSHATASPSESKMEYLRVWTATLTALEVQAEMASETRVKNTSVWGDWPVVANASDVSGVNSTLTVLTAVTYDTALVPISKTALPGLIASVEVEYTHTILRNNVLGPALIGSAEVDYLHSAIYRQLLTNPLISSGEVIYPWTVKQGFPRVDLGATGQSAQYTYNGIKATEVELSYHPKQTMTGLLWQTKSQDPLKVSVGETRNTLISPETTEGFKIVPFSISTYFTGGSTYTATTTDTFANVTALVIATFVQEGQQIRLNFVNASGHEVTITAALYGSGYYSKDVQKLLWGSTSLLAQNLGFHRVMRVNLSLLSDEVDAKALAVHYLNILQNQIDGIFSATYNFGFDTSDSRMFLFGLHIGDVIRINEEQTAVVYAPFLILGETISYDPTSGLKLTHTLLPVEA